ncbi:DUF721 domain-containing protein [candidate division WOR-3 bacterium]|nr:DUF721 domain-containing protein [candidate division WOR-3 bacterium]
MRKEPQSIDSILPIALKKFGLKKGIDQHKALIIWNKVVGEEIASHTKPGWINYGILWVIVDDPIWHQELGFLKPQIIERINQHLDQTKIRGIKFIQKRR